MLILTSVQNSQPDYVALAMVLVLVIIVAVMAIRKRVIANKPKANCVEASVPAGEPEQISAPGAAGQVKLHDVEPKKAAMLMAIVADKMGKPLNELRFISIKEVK